MGTIEEDRASPSCISCGSKLCRHGGHGGPLRRFGWYRYACGRKWHPEYEWDRQRGECRAGELQRTIDILHEYYGRTECARVVRRAKKRGA